MKNIIIIIILLCCLSLVGVVVGIDDACGVSDGNNCTCLQYGDQYFSDAKCNISIDIHPSDPNVIVVPGSCGFVTWELVSGTLPQGLTLSNITGIISGTIEPNGIIGFPIPNNPLELIVEGTTMLYPHTFNVKYTFLFVDLCSCFDYNDGNACNGLETCDPMDGQMVPGVTLDCNSTDMCITGYCNSTSGCVQTVTTYNDNDVCNGEETCDSSTGLMVAGTPLNCTIPSSPCNNITCNSTIGCVEKPLDAIGQSCYTGPNGTMNIGICKAGIYTCNASSGLVCGGQVVPLSAFENCGTLGHGNGLDDNCNGLVDEGCNGVSCVTDGDCFPFRQHDRNCNSASCNTNTSLCVFFPASNGTSCPTGNPCYESTSGMCDGVGTCIGTILSNTTCQDNNVCTEDSCLATIAFTGTTPFLYTPATCKHNQTDPLCFPCSVSSDCNSHPNTPCYSWNCTLGRCVEFENDLQLIGCTDNNVCNGLETCSAGVCSNGTALNCDDGNPCTTDTCSPIFGCNHDIVSAAGNACNDTTNLCNIGGTCNVLGACVGMLNVDCLPLDQCSLPGTCDPLTGLCIPGGFAVNGTICEFANNSCVSLAKCFSGICTPVANKQCPPQSACEDSGVCNPLDGSCSKVLLPVGTVCDEGLFCVTNATCNVTGSCVAQTFRNCSYLDSDCGIGKCDDDAALCYLGVKLPTGGPCDADGSICTLNDTCVFGTCTAGDHVVCDDGNPCTTDSCDPILGCTFTANDTLTCSGLGTFCNTNPRCESGICVTTPRNCSSVATNFCKNATCSDVYNQCMVVNINEGLPIPGGDGLICNGVERCQHGQIIHGVPLSCIGNSTCSSGRCIEPTGCVYNYTSAVCQDGDPCTINDMCISGSCVGGGIKDCSYLNTECRLGYCDSSNHGICTTMTMNEGGVCEILTQCTAQKQCVAGLCKTIGPGLDCNDNNVCTVDTCNSILGCSNVGPVPDVCGVCGGNETNSTLCVPIFEGDDDEDHAFILIAVPMGILFAGFIILLILCGFYGNQLGSRRYLKAHSI